MSATIYSTIYKLEIRNREQNEIVKQNKGKSVVISTY